MVLLGCKEAALLMGKKKGDSNFVVYVPGEIEIDGPGTYFFSGDKVTTKTHKGITTKSAAGFNNSVVIARECLDYWRSLGFSGAPYSPASFWREVWNREKRRGNLSTKTNASVNNMFRDYLAGGWIETRKKGACIGRHYQYDINKAYLWAGGLGLPRRFFPYQKGDKNYVVLMEMKTAKEDLPNRFSYYPRTIVTNEDVEYYGITGKVIHGVSFKDYSLNPNELLFELTDMEEGSFKRLTQSYWGVWAMGKPIRCQSISAGLDVKNEWYLKNRLQNIVYASIIINRVVRKVHSVMKEGGVSCFVDSVITPNELYTTDEIVGWKLEHTFDRGVYILAPGVLHEYPEMRTTKINHWLKHAGYQNARTESEEAQIAGYLTNRLSAT